MKRDWARYALAVVRLFNGVVALLAPGWLIARLGVEPKTQGAAYYVFRMFGIRTILIGLELLLGTREQQARSLRYGVLIHASDTLAALLAGAQGRLPWSGAKTVVALSALNTALAVIGSAEENEDDQE